MKVFLSYSRRDNVVANEVRRQLELHGHEIWQDVSSIAGGADWRASIEQGIRAADTFLLILSPQLVRSPKYAREELDFARKHDKALLPVYAKPVKVPCRRRDQSRDVPGGVPTTVLERRRATRGDRSTHHRVRGSAPRFRQEPEGVVGQPRRGVQ